MKVFSNDSLGGSTTIPEGVLQRYLRGFNNDTYYLRGFNNETWGCSATIPEGVQQRYLRDIQQRE